MKLRDNCSYHELHLPANLTTKSKLPVKQKTARDYRTRDLTINVDLLDALFQGLSTNTKRTYTNALRHFAAWLDGAPVDQIVVTQYIEHLRAEGKAIASARMIVAALRKFAAKAGHPIPVDEWTLDALRDYARETSGRGRGQTHALHWEQACEIADFARRDYTLFGLRDCALIRVMADGMLRSSEVSALRVSDFEIAADGSGRLHVRQSKTDQAGEGATLYLGAPTVECVDAWLRAAAKASIVSDYLFRRLRRNKHAQTFERLSADSVRLIVKRRARAAGLPTPVCDRVSGHSFRRGTTQSLVKRGATLPQVQDAGRWRDPKTPSIYAKSELAAQGAVARLLYTNEIDT